MKEEIEILKEFTDKVVVLPAREEWWNGSNEDITLSMYIKHFEEFLIEHDKRVHNNALKIVEEGLPKDRNGYGIDRAEVINNIQKLKI